MWIKFVRDINLYEGIFRVGDVREFGDERATRLISRDIAKKAATPRAVQVETADIPPCMPTGEEAERAVVAVNKTKKGRSRSRTKGHN